MTIESGHKEKAFQSAPPWASGNASDKGSWARAALLSGPPGVGKTSAALVVCAEVGLATIELNASDTRSKRSLKDEVSQALGMRSLAGCLTGSDGTFFLLKYRRYEIDKRVYSPQGNRREWERNVNFEKS